MLVKRGDSHPHDIPLCVTVCSLNPVYELVTTSFFFVCFKYKKTVTKAKTHHYFIFQCLCSDSHIINTHSTMKAQCVLDHVIGKCK